MWIYKTLCFNSPLSLLWWQMWKNIPIHPKKMKCNSLNFIMFDSQFRWFCWDRSASPVCTVPPTAVHRCWSWRKQSHRSLRPASRVKAVVRQRELFLLCDVTDLKTVTNVLYLHSNIIKYIWYYQNRYKLWDKYAFLLPWLL